MPLIWETKHPDFTFIWKIENLSLCTQKIGERISSPEFIVEILDGSKWQVDFYPKGMTDNGFFSVYLRRSFEDDGSSVVCITYRLVFVPTNLIPLNSAEPEDQTDFKKGDSWGFIDFLEMSVLEQDSWKKLYLTNDTLIIRCDIWKLYPERRTAKECCGRTTIGTERISLMWPIKAFSETKSDFIDTLSILSAGKREHLFDIVMRFEAPLEPKADPKVKTNPKPEDLQSQIDEKILIDVKRVGKSIRPIFTTCKLSVMDRDGVPRNPELGKHLFDTSDVTQVWNFLTWKSKREVLEEDQFLKQDVLTLYCELVYSSGTEDSKIEECNYVFPPYVDTMHETNKLSTLKDDLKSLYEKEGLCDVVLRVGEDCFPAHALVLSARSPVLSKMIKDARLRSSGDVKTSDESGGASGESISHESKIDDKDSVNEEPSNQISAEVATGTDLKSKEQDMSKQIAAKTDIKPKEQDMSKQISVGGATETDRKTTEQGSGGKDETFFDASDEDRITSLTKDEVEEHKTEKIESGKDWNKHQDESSKDGNGMSDVQGVESHQSKNDADTEESLDRIILDINLDPEPMKEFLNFIYTDTVEHLDFYTALDLYCAATLFEVSSLKLRSLSYMKMNLSVDTACDIYGFGHSVEDDLLKNAAYEYISNHVVDVLISDEWIELTKSKGDLAKETCVQLRSKRLKLEI